MSWEAWGTPPDDEPELCPLCDNSQHTPDKCEVAAAEDHARKHYEGAIALLLQDRERKLTEAYAEGRKDEAEEWCGRFCSCASEDVCRLNGETKPTGWLPIESAPIDENVMIAATPDWVGAARQDLEYPEGVERLVWKWSDGSQIHPNIKPTHWMPLPQHPEAA